MSIKVKFFASLTDLVGMKEIDVEFVEKLNVIKVWENVCSDAQMPVGCLYAINHDYCEPDQSLKDGDEVAYFPPLTGG
jgi:sulfur-carrier protein